jgi:DNA topoisomerase IA
MPLDHLLLEMERSQIGRPSTCSRALERLVEKGLLQPPIYRGQVRLTPSGLKTALALEANEPELSTADFCSSLAASLSDIESGKTGPRNVLGDLLSVLVPDHPNKHSLRSRIWNSLTELNAAQRLRVVGVYGAGVISPLNGGGQA